jgi:hypothetical protein
MGSVFPGNLLLLHKTHVSLVEQRSGLQCVIGAFPAHHALS